MGEGGERSEDGGGKVSFHRANKLLTEREECEDVGWGGCREANANRYREERRLWEEVVGR